MRAAVRLVAVSALLLLVGNGAFAADNLADLVNAGQHDAALKLVTAGTDVNQASVDGTTALHWAAYKQDVALVELLLKHGANPNRHNDYGATPMSVASENGNYTIMQALVRAGGDIESPNAEGQTVLMAVARTGNTDTAKLLLDKGAKVNVKENWGGQTALMWAASQQQPAMIKLLLKHGAEVNARGKDQDWPRWVTSEPRIKALDTGGFTPLLYAAREGCSECVAALLDGGADINLTDLWGETPLLMATLNLHYDTAQLLIQRGADIKRWDWWGRTALYNCIDLHLMSNTAHGDLPSTDKLTALDIAKTLLDKGAYVNMRLKHEPTFRGGAGDRGYTDGTADSRAVSAGSTALHKAAKAGDIAAVKLLLQYKARVDIANIMYEVTPILAAGGVWRVYGIFKDNPMSGQYTTGADAAEIVKLLMAAGANIKDRASNGQNIAHGAAKAGWNQVLQLAWDNGVDFTTKDVGGLTPRDLAAMKGHADTVALIDKLLGGKPGSTSVQVVADLAIPDAIVAALPVGLTPQQATADQIAQAATNLAFNLKGNLESNITQVMVALGEMTRAGKFSNAQRFGDNNPQGRFYLKVMNMASSNLDVSSKTYYGLTVLDLTRIAAAAHEGMNIVNGARSNAITRKKD
ncbi:MAG TPA: ankyrin repeat domain-containing protein [Candidatus Acidoferrum sp.]|nr:ankyrin repeat domain-containing protein [Candidatus Acidoferrum sp.]